MQNPLLELKIWRWQRYTALLLLPLVGFHVVYQYFVLGMDSISHDAVSGRLQLAVFLAIDVALLIVVSAHAYIGLRSILMDYAKSPAAARRASLVVACLLAATVLYGLLALFAFL